MSTTQDFNSDVFIQKASRIWRSFKFIRKVTKPLRFVDKAADMVERAAQGRLASSSVIDRVGVFIAEQKRQLSQLVELSRRDENFWWEESGGGWDKDSVAEMQTFFSTQIQNFRGLQMLMIELLPVVQSAKQALSNPVIRSLWVFKSGTTAGELDEVALSNMVGDLNNSIRSIDAILDRLRTYANSSYLRWS